MGRHILHIDMNCFYASVEMQRHPEYRNVPLAVCGSQEDRHGIVLTANYLAKPRGVKVGQAIWQAKQVCPELVTLPPDMSEYIRFSHMAREIYEDYTDQIEPFGLDENWLDVTGSVGCKGSPTAIAQEISERIKFELGITASIGVADNKITAKLGSDYKKPDAITRIEADNYREIVYPLPVDDLLYVGPATSRKLHGIGVHTIGQLAELDTDCLVHKFGKMGIVLKTFAMGQDRTPVTKTDHIPTIKSVGNSATTPRDMTCDEDVHLMLLLLAESVTSRMRELCSKCTTVEVSIRDTGLSWFTRQRKLPMPSCSSDELARGGLPAFQGKLPLAKPHPEHWHPRLRAGGSLSVRAMLCFPGGSAAGTLGAARQDCGRTAQPLRLSQHPQSGHVRRSAARQHQPARRSHRPPGRFLWRMTMDREKKYVPVLVRFDAEGKMRPVEIEFEEGQTFAVDRILDVRRAACQSVGGVGDRYACQILGKETYLWFEKGRWFVAAKI